MRTDLTTYCPRCLVRFRPGARCPECDSAAVYDLTDRTMRENALDANQAEQSQHREGQRLSDAFTSDWRGRALIAFCLFTVVFVLLGASRIAPPGWTILASIAIAVAATAAMSLGKATGRAPARASRRPHGVQILSPARNEPEVLATADRVVVRGVIRPGKTIASPLSSRQCVAFALSGDGVSDAGFTRFEIDVEGGGRAVVEGRHATVELTTGQPAAHETTAQLREFLHDRFVFRNPDSLPLAETVLGVGDTVEIEGSWKPHAEPELYRAVQWVKVFREEPGSPLVIREPVVRLRN